MIVKRKKIKAIDPNGYENGSTKVMHDSGPGYSSNGYSNSYSSSHVYSGDSKEGKRISRGMDRHFKQMEKEMEDIWKF